MTNIQARPQQLEDRTIEFATSIVYFCKRLPDSAENKIIAKQLIRAASNIGANYTEANNSSSKQDFKNKIYLSKKEAAETRYWLKLTAKTNRNIDVEVLIDEVTQLLFIFQKIASSLKNGK